MNRLKRHIDKPPGDNLQIVLISIIMLGILALVAMLFAVIDLAG